MSFSEPQAMPPIRCLWLVRHGESTWNARGLVQGQIPLPTLTVLGQRQARQCANRLADEPVGMLVSSDLRRALQTAGPVARALGLQIVEDSRLRERSLGAAEATLSRLLGPDQSGVLEGKVVDADAAPEGGESIRTLYQRAVASVTEHIHVGDGDLALVCHGGVVRVLLAWLDGIGPDAMAWRDVENALPIRRTVTAPALVGY